MDARARPVTPAAPARSSARRDAGHVDHAAVWEPELRTLQWLTQLPMHHRFTVAAVGDHSAPRGVRSSCAVRRGGSTISQRCRADCAGFARRNGRRRAPNGTRGSRPTGSGCFTSRWRAKADGSGSTSCRRKRRAPRTREGKRCSQELTSGPAPESRTGCVIFVQHSRLAGLSPVRRRRRWP